MPINPPLKIVPMSSRSYLGKYFPQALSYETKINTNNNRPSFYCGPQNELKQIKFIIKSKSLEDWPIATWI